MRCLVTGGGGFIGHHLVKRLKRDGLYVVGADLKLPEFESTLADEFMVLDLRQEKDCRKAVDGCEWVYHLAADMGGIQYISNYQAEIVRNNTRIDLNVLEASKGLGVKRILYTSSACVYPAYLQGDEHARALKEEDAYPAMPEPGYGWEKLYAELMFQYFREDYALDSRIVRFHNIFGELGTYDGGREKSPAAICRKVALAKDGDEIEIWGDGNQIRSYCYIDDCIDGILKIMNCDYPLPVNIGTDRAVTINELVDIVSKIAGKTLKKRYDPTKPKGVRSRNADTTLIEKLVGWKASTSLEAGLERTYRWIEGELRKAGRIK